MNSPIWARSFRRTAGAAKLGGVSRYPAGVGFRARGRQNSGNSNAGSHREAAPSVHLGWTRRPAVRSCRTHGGTFPDGGRAATRGPRGGGRVPKCEDPRGGARLSALLPLPVSLTPPLARLDSISQKARIFARFCAFRQLPRAAPEHRPTVASWSPFTPVRRGARSGRMDARASVVSVGCNGIRVRSSAFACHFTMGCRGRSQPRGPRRAASAARITGSRHGSCLLAQEKGAAPLGGLVSEETAA